MKSKELFNKLIRAIQFFKGSQKSKAAAITLAVLVVIGVGFMVYAAAYGDILPHVYVEDRALGGMSRDEALEAVKADFADITQGRSVTVKCVDSEKTVSLSELGISADPDTTVEQAFSVGRQGGIFRKTFSLLKSLVARTDVPLAIAANDAAVSAVIDELSAPYTVEVKNSEYHLEGNTLVITKGEPGKVVNKEKVMALLFDVARHTDISEISMVPENTDPKKVDVDKFYEALSYSPQDAYYKYEDGQVTIVDEMPKIIVTKDVIKQAFESDDMEIRIPVEVEMPEKTAEELRGMLFRDTLATYSSSFASSSASRAENVRLSASRVNGYILMPGDVFSYDSAIGRRTAANGYREAGVYVGNKQETGIGGGICQTSSTLYSAALYANLEIVTRTSHSLPVSYVPAGMDATIAEGYIDLKIRNNTQYPVKLVAVTSGRNLTCKVLGVKTEGQSVEIINTRTGTLSPKTVRTFNEEIPVGYKKVIAKGAGGYTVASKRIVKMNGEVVRTEKLTNSVYKAADIEEEINPADKDTPSSSLAIYDENNPPSAEPKPDETTSVVNPETPDAPVNPPTEEKPEETPVDVPTINTDTPPEENLQSESTESAE